MRLYNLGKVPWQESQLIYHTLAELGWEALSLVSPATPYVCVGFHQDVEQEIDLAYCDARSIPVFRRDVGGGAVYLDGDQLFFHLILHKDHPEVPKNKEIFYRKFLRPIINVYRRIGIPALHRPVNDVLAGTKKISGTGVGEIGDCIVLVGNLILDFNHEEMSRVLKVPDEKFRDKIHKTLRENLTTIRRELGEKEASRWDEATLSALIAEEFQSILGPMTQCEKDAVLQAKMDELGAHLMSEEWLFQTGKTVPDREVRIRAGLNVIQRSHKAPGGLLRANYEVREGRIRGVSVSGDFFCFPRTGIGSLENRLEGQRIENIGTLLAAFYAERSVEIPGITVQDWLQVFKPWQCC
jgi:lipoate-protein ligase A